MESLLSSYWQSPILVETKEGTISGSKMKTKQGREIFSFRSIPYGMPPVGDRRFMRSKAVGGWSGVVDGTKESPKSLQPNVLFPEWLSLREGSEDCLYLNVYSKVIQKVGETRLKVLKVAKKVS